MVLIMIRRILTPAITMCAGLAWGGLALAQDIGSGSTGGSTGSTSGSGTVNTGSTGGSGGFGGGVTGGTGSGDSFLGTGGNQAFITSGYEPGALGHAAKAGAATATNTGALFSRFYVNPYALGMTTTGNTRPTAFGTPLYTSLYPGTQTTTGAGGAGGRGGVGGGVGVTPGVTGTVGTTRVGGGAGGVGGITGGIGGLGGTGTTTGFRPPAAYQTAIAFPYNPTTPPQRQLNLEAVLARSTTLGTRNIRVEVDGNAVILRGSVADPADRRRAENLLRLTPGVRLVKNELTVTGP